MILIFAHLTHKYNYVMSKSMFFGCYTDVPFFSAKDTRHFVPQHAPYKPRSNLRRNNIFTAIKTNKKKQFPPSKAVIKKSVSLEKVNKLWYGRTSVDTVCCQFQKGESSCVFAYVKHTRILPSFCFFISSSVSGMTLIDAIRMLQCVLLHYFEISDEQKRKLVKSTFPSSRNVYTW